MSDHWPLIGREAELDLIADTRERNAVGGVLIGGAAGVGKSRLLTEAVTAAAADGWQVRRVAGTATGRRVALGAFTKWAGRVRGSATVKVERLISAVLGDSDAPILVAVDDAHLLDELSAFVVHQLLMREQAVVLLTIRTGESAPDAITSPWKDGLLRHVQLEPLSRRDCDHLLAAVLGGSVPEEYTQQAWDRTRGNMVFLRHLIETDCVEGRLVNGNGRWRCSGVSRLSPSLRDLVLAQMGDVPKSVSDVVNLVASAGSIDRHCLAGLAEAAAIDDAARRGLVIMPAEDSDEISVGHPLYAEAMLARCGPLQLSRLRGRIALALRRHDPAAVDAVRLGLLWLESDLPPDPEILADAAEAAAERLDMALAERCARAAVEAGAGRPARMQHARVLHFLGRGSDVEFMLDGLEDDASRPGKADAVILRASNLLWIQGDPDGAARIIDLASRDALGADLHKLRAFRALQLAFGGAPGEVISVIKTLDISLLDRKARILARFAETLALADLGRTRQASDTSDRGLPAPPYSVEETILTMSLTQGLVLAQTTAGCLAEAVSAAAQFGRRYRNLSEMGRAAASGVAGTVALRRGDLAGARDELAAAIHNVSGYLRPSGVAYRYLIHYTEALARSGDLSAATAAMASASDARRPVHAETETLLLLTQSWIDAGKRQSSKARVMALRAAAAARDRDRAGHEVLCLQTAIQFGDTTVADRLMELSRLVDDPRVVVATRYAQALAANDPFALSAASEDFEAMGDRLAAADAAGHAAIAFRAANLRGSALTASGRAMRIAYECGATSPAIVGARVVLPLTRREREIAILVARGLPNRTIADVMSLSVRTVEGHVYRASVKAGVTTRAELARVIGEFDSSEAAAS